MKIYTLILCSFLVACASNSYKASPTKVEENIPIGVSLKANRYDNIYFSGQPSLLDIRKMKKQGFTHIINLRESSEHDEKAERLLAKSLDIKYTQKPFIGKKPLTDEYIDSVTQAVKAHRHEGKTLIHCGSGNRAGVWAGGHFYKDHKYSKNQSVVIAKKMGMKREKPLLKLQDYLNSK